MHKYNALCMLSKTRKFKILNLLDRNNDIIKYRLIELPGRLHDLIAIIKHIKLFKKYDIVICDKQSVSGFIIIIITHLWHKKFFLRARGFGINERKNIIYKLINRYIYLNSDYVCCVSKGLENKINKFLKRNWPESSAIYNANWGNEGLYNNSVENFRDRNKNNNVRLLTIMSCNYKKKIYPLIELLNNLPYIRNCIKSKGINVSWDMYLIGKFADDIKNKYSQNNSTRFITNQKFENKEKIYSNYDIFVYPTGMDELPSVLIESLCYGIPVVSYSYAGDDEIIETAKNGIIIPKGKLDKLIEAILEINGNYSFYSHNSRNSYQEKFSGELLAYQFRKLIQDIFENSEYSKKLAN